jgi:hypothetical protein
MISLTKVPHIAGMLLLMALMALMAACSDSRVDVYSKITNPRELGHVLYVERLNGHIVSRGNYASLNSEKIYDYLCLVGFFAKTINEDIVKLKTYTSDRSGFNESIVYKEIDQVEEGGLGPLTTSMIKPIPDAKEYIIIIRSTLEKTGLRVFKVNPSAMESITAEHPLEVPDLMTLPLFKNDPDSQKLQLLYDGLKKDDPK